MPAGRSLSRPSRVGVLTALERAAAGLRRIGLGRAVEPVARRFAPTLGTFDVDVDGLRLHGSHIGQLYYVRELLEDDREGLFLELLRSAIAPGATVVEAGAHIGYVTLQAARATGPSGRVIAFEPNPQTAPLVELNAKQNGFADRVTVVRLALGSAAGRAVFHLSGGGDTSSLHEPESASEQVHVEVARLDDWLDPSLRVDVVKLDVEGGEVDALRGMQATLERAADELVVFAECNPGMLARAGSSAAELVSLLEEHALDVRWIDEVEHVTRPFSEVDWTHGYVNLYCRRSPAP